MECCKFCPTNKLEKYISDGGGLHFICSLCLTEYFNDSYGEDAMGYRMFCSIYKKKYVIDYYSKKNYIYVSEYNKDIDGNSIRKFILELSGDLGITPFNIQEKLPMILTFG